jgi:hypothetical protein
MISLLSERLSVLFTLMFTREHACITLNRLRQTVIAHSAHVHVHMREHVNKREQRIQKSIDDTTIRRL